MRWVDAGRNLGSMVGFTVKMLNAYGPAVLREVVADMLVRGTHERIKLRRLVGRRFFAADGP